MKNDPISTVPAGRGHEASHSSLRAVLIIAVLVVAMVVFCLVSTEIVLRVFAKHRPMQPMQPLGILTAPDAKPLTHLPSPSLELDDGHADFTALSHLQSDKLNNYGWVDHTNGIARIPIDRAMDLIASRGLPVAKSMETTNNSGLRPNLERALP